MKAVSDQKLNPGESSPKEHKECARGAAIGVRKLREGGEETIIVYTVVLAVSSPMIKGVLDG